MKNQKRILLCLLILSIVLTVFVSCNKAPETDLTSTVSESLGVWEKATYTTDKEFGNGKKTITVEVKAGDRSVTFTVKTDKENLADALLEHKLVDGDDGQYGIYIKYVNGIQADYDVDQSYWSLTKNGEMHNYGASTTIITDGERYEFTYTK